MHEKIEKFLFVKGFKPLKMRTKIMVEYIYLIVNRSELDRLHNNAVKLIATKFGIPENNVIQHLYQIKKFYEIKKELQGSMTATDLAYSLADEFVKYEKRAISE